jgi:ketosteroid isomerase-like protein
VFGQFGRYGGDTGGTFKAELKEVFTSDDGRVIGLHRNTGMRNGKQLDTDCCIVFEIADGRMVSGREHFFDLGNWDEFWS